MPDDSLASGQERQLRFADDIRPLFRELDRDSMEGHFDLWSRADVLAHGEAIEARLREGTMPCDGEWPEEQITLFARWLAQGGQE